MRFPALALAASVAAGILIGETTAGRLPRAPTLFLGTSLALLLLSFILLLWRRVK